MPQEFRETGRIGEDLLISGFESLRGMAEAAEAISAEASACTRELLEAGTAGFERLAGVKSFGQAVVVQTDAARETYQAMVAGASRMSQLYADLGRRACRPFEDVIAKAP
jgi:hypothetical protein